MALIGNQGDDEVMSTINITPFTDVLLVLLIIFIILMSVTKEQRLPDAKNTQAVENSQIVVIVDAHNHVQIGSRQVEIGQAAQAFRQLADATGHRYTSVIIKADPDASYGVVLQVMDAARNADLTNFGLANHAQAPAS
jgi:biopolymer transport protein TolR